MLQFINLDMEDNALSSDEEGAKDGKENKSMLAGMFSFMNRNKSGNSASGDPNVSGIYLDEINIENMDPEVAALYFPNFHRKEVLVWQFT
jgi:hypothetical protein